jgi:hypothetical protein
MGLAPRTRRPKLAAHDRLGNTYGVLVVIATQTPYGCSISALKRDARRGHRTTRGPGAGLRPPRLQDVRSSRADRRFASPILPAQRALFTFTRPKEPLPHRWIQAKAAWAKPMPTPALTSPRNSSQSPTSQTTRRGMPSAANAASLRAHCRRTGIGVQRIWRLTPPCDQRASGRKPRPFELMIWIFPGGCGDCPDLREIGRNSALTCVQSGRNLKELREFSK